jgi:hypothetical protein
LPVVFVVGAVIIDVSCGDIYGKVVVDDLVLVKIVLDNFRFRAQTNY